MSDYGTVIAVAPTPLKKKTGRSRQKFYLNPILCPQFKIPYQRTKEPKYIHPTQDRGMDAYKAGLPFPESYRPQVVRMEEPELPLFGDGKDS